MEDNKDRRSFDRLEIPGMKAVLLKSHWYQLLSYKLFYGILKFLLKKTPLKNISVSGACITSNQSYNTGDSVHMIITIPGSSFIPVKGSVRWSSNRNDDNLFYAGVQFEAFSSGGKFNSYESLKQLQNHAKATIVGQQDLN